MSQKDEPVRDKFWQDVPASIYAWAALNRDGTIMANSVRLTIEDVKRHCGEDCVPIPVTVRLDDTRNK